VDTTIIGARIRSMDFSSAARSAGFSGFDSMSSVVRYALRLLVVNDHHQAMRDSVKPGTPGMLPKSNQVAASIPVEWVEAARKAVPDAKNDATLVRYALYRVDGYSHDEALHEATRDYYRGGRQPGAKDVKPRKRRTTST